MTITGTAHQALQNRRILQVVHQRRAAVAVATLHNALRMTITGTAHQALQNHRILLAAHQQRAAAAVAILHNAPRTMIIGTIQLVLPSRRTPLEALHLAAQLRRAVAPVQAAAHQHNVHHMTITGTVHRALRNLHTHLARRVPHLQERRVLPTLQRPSNAPHTMITGTVHLAFLSQTTLQERRLRDQVRALRLPIPARRNVPHMTTIGIVRLAFPSRPHLLLAQRW